MTTLSKQDAAQALQDIGVADRRMRQVRNYAYAAPFFILWGLIWLFANTVTDFAPARSGLAWMIGQAIGIPATLFLTWRQARGADDVVRAAFERDPRRGLKIGMTWMAVICFFAALTSITAPLTGKQVNAFISLFWACAYMAAGAWIGWRLFAIGAITAAAVVFGFHVLDQHYALWMGVVGGGSLIAGGLWLRKV